MLGVDLDAIRLVLGLVHVRIDLGIDQVDFVLYFKLLLDPPWLEVVVVLDVDVAIDVVVVVDVAVLLDVVVVIGAVVPLLLGLCFHVVLVPLLLRFSLSCCWRSCW